MTDTDAQPVVFRSNSEVAIHVPDLDEAEGFYVTALGFRLVTKTDEYLEIDTGSLRLYVNHDPETSRSFIPSFDVTDMARAREHLDSIGCRTVSLPNGGVYFEDPFGFVFDIVERVGA